MDRNEFKMFRKHRNLNQRDFGKFFGIQQELVSMYENGTRKIPEHIIKVMEAFPATDTEEASKEYALTLDLPVGTFKLVTQAFVAGAHWQDNFKAPKYGSSKFTKKEEVS